MQRMQTFVINPMSYKIADLEEQFYLSRKAEGRVDETIFYYRQKISRFIQWLGKCHITEIGAITPAAIRTFLMELSENHNQGGVHSFYRSIKAFLNWAWFEYEFEWTNPITKVKCAAAKFDPIAGVKPEDFDKLFAGAKKGKYPLRDCAIIAVLLDTGIRRSSLAAIRCCDVDLVNGSILIRHAKNGKPYTVYLGRKARQYVRRYAQTLSETLDREANFWLSRTGSALDIRSFRFILERAEERAGIERYSLHDFRRCFALEAWRNGADVYAVSEMLGHTGIEITKRYLATEEKDRQTIHAKISPLDRKMRNK